MRSVNVRLPLRSVGVAGGVRVEHRAAVRHPGALAGGVVAEATADALGVARLLVVLHRDRSRRPCRACLPVCRPPRRTSTAPSRSPAWRSTGSTCYVRSGTASRRIGRRERVRRRVGRSAARAHRQHRRLRRKQRRGRQLTVVGPPEVGGERVARAAAARPCRRSGRCACDRSWLVSAIIVRSVPAPVLNCGLEHLLERRRGSARVTAPHAGVERRPRRRRSGSAGRDRGR